MQLFNIDNIKRLPHHYHIEKFLFIENKISRTYEFSDMDLLALDKL